MKERGRKEEKVETNDQKMCGEKRRKRERWRKLSSRGSKKNVSTLNKTRTNLKTFLLIGFSYILLCFSARKIPDSSQYDLFSYPSVSYSHDLINIYVCKNNFLCYLTTDYFWILYAFLKSWCYQIMAIAYDGYKK